MSFFNRSLSILIVIISIGVNGVVAQNFTIQGFVKDKASNEAIPYATVTALSKVDKGLISGTTTKEDGSFKFKCDNDNFILELSFIGYKKKVVSPDLNNKVIDLGVILLESDMENLGEVEVTAEKSSVEFKLDKRVFNVGKDIGTAGLGAMDVLSRVPSVNVDIEGSVSLRGNTGVQILINGKPSVLSDEGSNALGTITADMIESIEVITNPSAKYEAEGTSGIINIILKKEEKKGFNGSVSLNTGMPANHSVGVSLNRRTENFNFFTQFGAGYRSLPRYRESINRSLTTGRSVESEGIEFRNENFYNITLGTDYHINDFNVLTLSGNFAYEIEDQPSETDFVIYDGDSQIESIYTREEKTSATNPKYQYDLQYEKQFKNNKEHVLLVSTLGRFFGKEQESEFINQSDNYTNISPNQITETAFFQRDFTFKADYTNPISKQFSVEAGGMYEINDVGNDYAVFNEDSTGTFLADSGLTNNFEFNQKVLGVYTTLAYEREKWGVKVGLRLENTDLQTVLTTTNQENNQNYTNLFPSIHSSYKISERFSLQAGYSRRIYRPRLWDLNPFFNIRNNFNIRRGNPNLTPEYGDSYELTGIFLFDNLSFNSSLYHMYTSDVMDRVTFFEDNVNVTMPVNIGTRNQTGFELNGKYTASKNVTLNGDFNYGYFSRKGELNDQSFDFEGTKWFVRGTGRFKLPKDFEFEVTANYNSRFETVQGEYAGFAFADLGVRKKLWKGKGVLNFSVRDIFASRKWEGTVIQPDFYSFDTSRRGRFLTLGFSYSFGKGEAMTYTGRRR